MPNTKLTLALLSSVCSLGLSMPAFAQDAADESAEDENIIVVTAQNRTQNVNDVPIAMNVVGAEELTMRRFRRNERHRQDRA